MRALAALCVLAGVAHAGPGTIVFTRLGSVLQVPADGSGPAVPIAELPDDATEVRWAESNADGRLVVLDFDSYSAWLVSEGPDRPVVLHGGGCTGRARPSPKGGAVVCPTRDGATMMLAVGEGRRVFPGRLDELSYRGPSATELAALTADGVVGFTCGADPAARRVLAQAGPRAHLLVAPDGEQAVAVFGEGDAGRVRSFLLDGQGISRQLGGPGVPTVWSWDSVWVLFDEGDIKGAPAPAQPGDEGALETPSRFELAAPRKKPRHPPKKKPEPTATPPTTRACVARATGGEVKCWDDFTGLAFAPDSTQVLLKKGTALYIGKIAGVRPEPPVQIIDGVDGAATWTPGPMGSALPRPAAGR
jgi:hypothetical protein